MRFNVRQIMGVIVLAAALSGVIAGVGRMVDQARRSARAAQCSGHLTQIALALHNYHGVNGCFPPAYVSDPNGRPMHSWRVLILPYIEQAKLYEAYNFAEPWDGPNNSRLAAYKPIPFACPNGYDYGVRSVRTNYLAIVGPGTVFPGSKSTSLSDVRDGTANTIMLAEVADTDIHWMEPRDLDVRTISLVVDDPSRPHISSNDPGDPHLLCVDGSRRSLTKAITPEKLKVLSTISGGEPLPAGWAR